MNPCIRVLQTLALPLGYLAISIFILGNWQEKSILILLEISDYKTIPLTGTVPINKVLSEFELNN